MHLTDNQINFIRQDILARGITLPELEDSLLDHICCALESMPGTTDQFETHYAQVLERFGPAGLTAIQTETIFLLTAKNKRIMKTLYSLGFAAAFLISNGIILKIMHWPGANIALLLGAFLLNFCVLPMFFYRKYKQSVQVAE